MPARTTTTISSLPRSVSESQWPANSALPVRNDLDTPTSRRPIMWFGVGIIGFIIWVAIAFWPARVAARKGHSFLVYFLVSLVFFPLALVLAYVAPNRRVAYR